MRNHPDIENPSSDESQNAEEGYKIRGMGRSMFDEPENTQENIES